VPYRNSKVEHTLLSKIVLSRFLTLPLKNYDSLVTKIESSTWFSTLRPWMSIERVAGAQVTHQVDSPLNQTATTLGKVQTIDRNLNFLYQSDSFVREYRFDEEKITRLVSKPDFPVELGNVVHQLRLINTRNRLTHALMQAVLVSQVGYLRSGQTLALLPLTQAALSAQLRLTSNLSVVADMPARLVSSWRYGSLV